MSVWAGQNRGNPPAARFHDLLEQIKVEFNNQHERAETNDAQRMSYLCALDMFPPLLKALLTMSHPTVANQIHEVDSIRRKLWELEQAQVQIKKQ